MKRHNDGIDVEGKTPSFQYYPADFERDVQMLSLSAQGLWARMLGWMHYSPRRGYLELPTGDPMTARDIAARVGRSQKSVDRALDEMKRIGLFSVDDRNCIVNRRMKRDTAISLARRKAAEARLQVAERDDMGRFTEDALASHPKFAGGFAPANGKSCPAKSPASVQQNTVPSYSYSSSDSCLSLAAAAASERASPPKNPARAAAAAAAPAESPARARAAAEVLVHILATEHRKAHPPGSPLQAVAAAAEILSAAPDIESKCREIRASHAAFMEFYLARKPRFIPILSRWFLDGDYLHPPGPDASRRPVATEEIQYENYSDKLREKRRRELEAQRAAS